jgi:hypothetical protein
VPRTLFDVVTAMQAADVDITGGPSAWDYVFGGCTIAAAVLAVIAIWFAVKAGRDLVQDRRHVFELGLPLEIHKQVQLYSATGGPTSLASMYVRLRPEDELPTFRAILGVRSIISVPN